MKLLLDENMPPRLGRSLGVLFEGEHVVQAIADKFGRGLPDEEWIEALGAEGSWCVLSGDRRIATKKPSRDLFLRSNLIGFFPKPALLDQPLPALAARILTMWPNMVATASTIQRGCFDIGISANKFSQIS